MRKPAVIGLTAIGATAAVLAAWALDKNYQLAQIGCDSPGTVALVGKILHTKLNLPGTGIKDIVETKRKDGIYYCSAQVTNLAKLAKIKEMESSPFLSALLPTFRQAYYTSAITQDTGRQYVVVRLGFPL